MQPTSKPPNQPAKQRVLRWLCAPAVLITLSFVYFANKLGAAAEIYIQREREKAPPAAAFMIIYRGVLLLQAALRNT
jgi:hypothetical protein